MAYEDPIIINVNAVAQSMPRISTEGQSSIYRKADGTYRFEVAHSTNTSKRARNTTSGVQSVPQTIVTSNVRFVNRKIVADPVSNANDYEELRIELKITRPEVGFTSSDLDLLWAGLKAYLVTAKTDKLFALET